MLPSRHRFGPPTFAIEIGSCAISLGDFLSLERTCSRSKSRSAPRRGRSRFTRHEAGGTRLVELVLPNFETLTESLERQSCRLSAEK